MLVATVAGACSGLPSTGPVVEGRPLDEAPLIDPISSAPQGPITRGTQEQIVRGFIGAGEDTDETHGVAKSFLVPSSVDLFQWSTSEVAVYGSDADLRLRRIDDDSIEVKVPATGFLSPSGRYRDAAPGTVVSAVFGLTKVMGEWRINLPRTGFGIWLDVNGFNRLYVGRPVYYVAPTGNELVPDLRWFLNTRKLATSLARAQLEPVPSHLATAVRTGVPNGTRLAVNAVPIVAGHAQIDLSTSALDASPEARTEMYAQLSQTLSQVSVTSISLTADGTAIELPIVGASINRPLDVGYGTVRWPTFDVAWLRNGSTLTSIDPSFRPDGDLSKQRMPTTPQARWPAQIPTVWKSLAMSADQREIAGVGGDEKQLSRWPVDLPVVIYNKIGTSVTRPTYDAAGYLWFASAQAAGRFGFSVIDTELPKSAPAPVSASWLGTRRVVTLTLAPDRARALIVTTDARGERPELHLAGVVRSTDGVPTALTEPMRLGEPLTVIKDVVWLDPLRYAVLGRTTGSDSVGPITGSVGGGLDLNRSPTSAGGAATNQLQPVRGALSLTTVGGPLGLIVVTDPAQSKVLARAGSTWRPIANGTELLVPGR